MLGSYLGIILYQLMLIMIVLLSALAVMEKNKENYIKIAYITICFVMFFLFRALPNILGIRFFDIPWESRVFTIFSSIFCLFCFKKHFLENNYFKIRQDKKNINIKITLIVSMLTFVGYLIIYYYRGSRQEFNMELMLFLSTVVGIEEEIFFRGILLGLLMSCLNEKKLFIKYLAILISGIVFGLWHGNFTYFDPVHIITNCFYGYIMGWITIKNKSILIPIIVHNLINGFGYLITVILI